MEAMLRVSDEVTESDVQTQIAANIMANKDAVLAKIKAYLAATQTAIDVTKLTSIAWAQCYEADVDLVDFNYSDVATNYTPEIVGERIYDNQSGSSNLEDTFTYSKTLTETFTFGFTEGLKVGASAKLKATLPLIGEAETTLSAEVTFNANQSWTSTESRTWSQSTKITVPPHAKVKVTAFVNEASITARFSGEARATDGRAFIGIYINDPSNIVDVIVPITAILTDDQRSVPLAGTLDAAEGVLSYTKIEPIA